MGCTELLAAFLQYDPEARIWPLDACAHHCFDSLRDQRLRCPDGQPLPPDLFNLTQREQSICSLELRKRLVPAWHVTASAAWSPGSPLMATSSRSQVSPSELATFGGKGHR